MAHSPLNMFRQFHNKFSLVIGQGPVRDVARALGFKNITTIEMLQRTWPKLDVVDHARRALDVSTTDEFFNYAAFSRNTKFYVTFCLSSHRAAVGRRIRFSANRSHCTTRRAGQLGNVAANLNRFVADQRPTIHEYRRNSASGSISTFTYPGVQC